MLITNYQGKGKYLEPCIWTRNLNSKPFQIDIRKDSRKIVIDTEGYHYVKR